MFQMGWMLSEQKAAIATLAHFLRLGRFLRLEHRHRMPQTLPHENEKPSVPGGAIKEKTISCDVRDELQAFYQPWCVLLLARHHQGANAHCTRDHQHPILHDHLSPQFPTRLQERAA